MTASHFRPRPADAAGILSFVHLGDLHMTHAGEQNELDLRALVEEMNRVFAPAISFVYLPGDVAEHGDVAAYEVARRALDPLQAPWCAIVGDHDVHERSFAPFLAAMWEQTQYAFTAGAVRFVAMNAFEVPDPGSFTVSAAQLEWADRELAAATEAGLGKVVLLHCYPSDLKQGGAELSGLLRRHAVALVDMGHTHYNEISHDGQTLYTATRSTGQIEEGPVGFSITNFDAGVVSWRFVPLGELPVVVITSPVDERLRTAASPAWADRLTVRAKVWSDAALTRVVARAGEQSVALTRIPGSYVWMGELAGLPQTRFRLEVQVEDAHGRLAEDAIEVASAAAEAAPRQRHPRDQDNALAAWPEHGLLGTQLGPNKNGRKW